MSFPVPVFRNRFFTPLCVFSFCPAMSVFLPAFAARHAIFSEAPGPSRETALPAAGAARSARRPPPEPALYPASPCPSAGTPFRGPEHHGYLGLVPVGQEPLHLAHLRLQIVLIGPRSQLDFLEMRTLLVLLGGVGFLAQLILVLAEVHDLTDRRLSRRRDLDKIISQFFRFLQGINRRHDAELFALRTDDAYWRYSDLSIDPQFWNGDRAPLSFRFKPWAWRWLAPAPPPPAVNASGS